MDDFVNKKFFSRDDVVLEYARATANIGLWESERLLIEKFVPRSAKILELGAGTGRVSLGLRKIGYADLTITDFAPPMIETAKFFFAENATTDPAKIRFAVEDATALSFATNSFDAAIFAFNGLQMIPKRERRKTALREIARVLRLGGIFIFTGHDQTHRARQQYWREEQARWANGSRDKALDDFGDYNHATPRGTMFIHAAVPADVEHDLAEAGFATILSQLRSEICDESPAVREFSDDTRFWVCKKSVTTMPLTTDPSLWTRA